jgi:hypothetical protein
MTGFEPATSASRTHEARVISGTLFEVTTPAIGVSAVVSPKTRKTDRGTGLDDTCDLGEPTPDPRTDDAEFSATVTAIMTLPLSDAEKAEAVRRLLAGR